MNDRPDALGRGSWLAWTLASLFVLAASSLAGCEPAGGADSPAASGRSATGDAPVMIDSVNYMHERGVEYTLYDLAQKPPRAIGGAVVNELASGGEKGCCISLPKTWRPGMKVRLDWQEGDNDKRYDKQSREMEIPRYDTPADLYVVFYPPHEVELVVSKAEPGHPEWRGSIKQTPWEQCVQTYGRKTCKAALPKLFDVKSTGLCTYMQDQKTENAADLCLSATLDCMRDYEDEDFCKNILWGTYKK